MVDLLTLLHIRENVPLGDFTTFRVGGPARFFCEISIEPQLEEALWFAAAHTGGKFFILGGGSNILVSDEGFDGLVILMNIKGFAFKEDAVSVEGGKITAEVGAGENWDNFISECVSHGFTSLSGGLENLSGIPGTVGAAPVQNIGAYGVEAADIIQSVRAYDTHEKRWRNFSKNECGFAYRDSIFKQQKNRYVITSVIFTLQKFISPKITPLNLNYKDIQEYFSKTAAKDPSDIRTAVLSIRARKLPDVCTIGTAGSFFKNPIIYDGHYLRLKKDYPDLPSFVAGEGMVKVPLGWILDHICGYRGITKGQVGTYQNQALVIVNNGGATAAEIKKFADEIIATVKEKTKIDIEPEVQYI